MNLFWSPKFEVILLSFNRISSEGCLLTPHIVTLHGPSRMLVHTYQNGIGSMSQFVDPTDAWKPKCCSQFCSRMRIDQKTRPYTVRFESWAGTMKAPTKTRQFSLTPLNQHSPSPIYPHFYLKILGAVKKEPPWWWVSWDSEHIFAMIDPCRFPEPQPTTDFSRNLETQHGGGVSAAVGTCPK